MMKTLTVSLYAAATLGCAAGARGPAGAAVDPALRTCVAPSGAATGREHRLARIPAAIRLPPGYGPAPGAPPVGVRLPSRDLWVKGPSFAQQVSIGVDSTPADSVEALLQWASARRAARVCRGLLAGRPATVVAFDEVVWAGDASLPPYGVVAAVTLGPGSHLTVQAYTTDSSEQAAVLAALPTLRWLGH